MRGPISFVIVMLLAGASLEGQAGPRGTQPAKVVKPEAPPAKAHAPAPVVDAHVAPAKPVVQPAVQRAAKPVTHAETKPPAEPTAKPGAHAETKPAAQQPAKPGAPAAAAAKPAAHAAATAKPVAPAPAKAPTKSLEEAAESIAAALKARGVRRSSRARAESEPSAPRLKRYALYWPPDDTKWDVQWPVISGRVALTWDEPSESSDRPASH